MVIFDGEVIRKFTPKLFIIHHFQPLLAFFLRGYTYQQPERQQHPKTNPKKPLNAPTNPTNA